MTAPGIEWDDERGRYVNRGLEAEQARHRLAGLFTRTIVEDGDLPTVITATLEHTQTTTHDVVAALVIAAQDAAHNGDTEAEAVRHRVTELLHAWLASTARGES